MYWYSKMVCEIRRSNKNQVTMISDQILLKKGMTAVPQSTGDEPAHLILSYTQLFLPFQHLLSIADPLPCITLMQLPVQHVQAFAITHT